MSTRGRTFSYELYPAFIVNDDPVGPQQERARAEGQVSARHTSVGGQEQGKRGSKPARSAGRAGARGSRRILGRPERRVFLVYIGVSPHHRAKTPIASRCAIWLVCGCVYPLSRLLRQRPASWLIVVGGTCWPLAEALSSTPAVNKYWNRRTRTATLCTLK